MPRLHKRGAGAMRYDAEPLFTLERSAPDMPVFDPERCAVRPVTYHQAKDVVAVAHYLHKLGSTSVALGLHVDGELAGVMTFGTIPRPNARAVCGEPHQAKVLELTRLALYDWAPRNSESWFIGQARAWLTVNRPDISILLSYADSSAGHVGTIYQATNWLYTGKSGGDVVWLCDDGTRMHPRTTGWDTSVLPPGRFVPSAGKFRYVCFLGSPSQQRFLRRALRWDPLPYPKLAQLAA